MKPLTARQVREARAALEKHGSLAAAARALGMPRSTLQSRVTGGTTHAPAEPARIVPHDRRELLKLRAEVAQLRRERGETDGAAMLAEAIAEARGRLAAEALPVPGWAVRADKLGDAPGVPMLLLTDWHIGETVKPAQVYNLNQFDAEVADARVRRVVERAIRLGGMHAPAGGHRGGVVLLGGDFVSGWLHEELVRTDWCTPLQSAAWCVSRLAWALRTLRDAWGRLYVVGVPGNHGRMTKRPPGKDHAFQSFDWLIYAMLAQQLETDRRTIEISVPDDGEQILQVAGTRYHLMHGHQLGVKGGDGLIGALGPITRGAMKTGSANRSVGRDSDVLVIGHYHTTLWLPRVIVGPTLKGYDEYARVSRFGYEPAAQLMWFSHPKWGPNCPLRLFLQDPPAREATPFVAVARAA